MRSISRFKNDVDQLSNVDPAKSQDSSSQLGATTNAMISLMPHHPKSINAIGTNVIGEDIISIYDRFYTDIIDSSKSKSLQTRHELCSSISMLEGLLRSIDPERVHYRVLMAVNMFKNTQSKLSDSEVKTAKFGLFPNEESFSQDLVELISECVLRIRSIVGLKILHETVAVAWQKVQTRPDSVDDPVVAGKSISWKCSPSPVVRNILVSTAKDIGVNVCLDLEKEDDQCINEISWIPSDLEAPSSETTLENGSEQPGTSNQVETGVSCARIAETIALTFPDNSAHITQHLFSLLASERSNDELQGELFDLLGFDHFELVSEILESRNQLNGEMRATKNLAKVSALEDSATVRRDDSSIYCQQVIVQTKSQSEARKELRREQKRARKELNRIQHAFGEDEKLELELAQRELMKQRQLEIDRLQWAPSLQSAATLTETYPFVFDARVESGLKPFTVGGMKMMLPAGTKHESHRTHESHEVPPENRQSVQDISHVYIKDMDEIGQLGFQGFEKLNVIQSIVFEQAYKTKENLLICAPTGAGKTNIAMLTILNTIHEYCKPNGEIAKDDFKIIYIAPMKALATEMTESFGKRLNPLGLTVKELTGDTQLSKKEVAETQMLVLTPEKWDVVTRKGAADNSLSALVRLLIIDEVHLLHDDRGPVIETIVARTLRQVEMSQSGIRIVGLSATLPNYVDVARFLRVNLYKGLFCFDGRFRPVPLTQKFIGIKKIGGVREVQETMDEVCYDEVFNYVRKGHQVLVFVHARNATAKLAQFFRERAAQLGHLGVFESTSISDSGHFSAEKAMKKARNSQLYEFFRFGLGIHHAGLVRSDRILVEKSFASGHIAVLFCTATLAWGVNLPAHAVVIRGTDVFDAEKGQFADLGVLDVQQIFGRAGRPQFENEGHGVIITTSSKLQKYLTMLTRQAPIESQFLKRMFDNLNAEIALGTVTNVDEAVEWLTYTYFYPRARLNPIAYGLDHNIIEKDPDLRNYLKKVICMAAQKLDDNQMLRFDKSNGFFDSTDLGRIASNFYVKFETIEQFNNGELPVTLGPFMAEDSVIALVSSASEFSQLKVREDECLDLEELISYGCVVPVRGGGIASVAGKVNVLLQAFISGTAIRSFSLSSESLYVQQNAGRLCRAMFEITLRKGWAQSTNACLTIAKCIEKRLWPNQNSLRQLMEFVPLTWIEKIESRHLSITRMLEFTPKDLGYMLSCDGEKLYDCLRMIPRLEVEATLKPITYTIVQVQAVLYPAFRWNDRLLGKTGAQSFWLFLENISENLIVYQERIVLSRQKVKLAEPQHVVFTIPVRDHQLTNNYQLRIASDYFLVEDTVIPLSMHNCVLPKSYKAHTELLPLMPLPVTTLRNPKFESIYSFSHFNPVQTQVFHSLYKTDENVLVGAPTGSGKTCCAELAIFHLLQDHPGKKCVYIAPLKALVRERLEDWKIKFEQKMNYKVIEVSGDVTPSTEKLYEADILITTPEKWDGMSRSWGTREYVRQVGLVIIDEIHLLGVDRGAVLEAIVTRMKIIARSAHNSWKVRVIGLSTALSNAGDVADWLGIEEMGLFNFRPNVRPVPISVHIKGFPGQHYCPRMALMNKPAFKAIRTYSPTKPVLVFVASRRQTRLTALAFISHLVADENPKQWMHMDMMELEDVLISIRDENLKLTLPFGIGMHHAGLSSHERSIVERLFLEKKIQVLIATATLAWGINMPAHLVIVKGTEFFDGKTCKYVDFPVTDVMQMIGRAGRPQFDDSAVAVIYVQDMKKNFYKSFLYEPFPVESSLLAVLADHVNAEINSGMINSKNSVMQYLAGTYFYRRLFANPNFYGLFFEEDQDCEKAMISFLINTVDNCINELNASNCIIINEEAGEISSSPYGRLAAIYYLKHETMRFLLENLNSTSSIADLLKTLTHVPEYAEVPVRHNEDNINSQLQQRLRIRFSTSVMDSSFTKTHLLMQAHFGRVNLPTDYRTDLRSVLDQCIRIIQAMRDICLLKRWFSTALNLSVFQQMCYSGVWDDDHPLLALPRLKHDDVERIGETMTIPLLQSEFGVTKSRKDSHKKLKNLLSQNTSLDEGELNEVIRAIQTWPIISLRSMRLSIGKSEYILHPNKGIKAPKESICRLIIDLQSENSQTCIGEAPLPHWTKEKACAWIIMVGDKDNDSLLAVSHVAAFHQKKTVKIDLRLPDRTGPLHLSVIIASDCLFGIDQEYQLMFNLQ